MAAQAWVVHDKAKQKMINGTLDMDTDTFVIRLYSSSSNVATTSVSDATSVTNELSTANGYTAGGVTLTGVSVSESGGTTTFDSSMDPSWTASGGPITAFYAAIVDTTATPDEVICHSQLNTASPSTGVTATDGNTLTITFNASGIFTLA